MNPSINLDQYQDQIEHLSAYIQERGLKFENGEELKSIMQNWINDGLKFWKEMQTPQATEFMYQLTVSHHVSN